MELKSSDQINELAAALAKFQAEAQNPKTTKLVTVTPKNSAAYTYKYTPLNDIIDSIRAGMAKNGLSCVQSTGGDVIDVIKKGYNDTEPTATTGTTPFVVTRLIHASGQWIETDPLHAVSGAGAQEIGSAISYARRYQLAAVLGLATDDDDDASGADGKKADIAPKAAPTYEHKATPVFTAMGFSEVALPDSPTDKLLNTVPMAGGKMGGKPWKDYDLGYLKWMIEESKFGEDKKAPARQVLAWKKAQASPVKSAKPAAREEVPMPTDADAPDEELKEEPPF